MKPTLLIIEGKSAARTADPVDSRVRDFLDGDTDGSELFAALYSHVGREPIPARLRLAAGLDREAAHALGGASGTVRGIDHRVQSRRFARPA